MKKLTYTVSDSLYDEFRAAYPSSESLQALLDKRVPSRRVNKTVVSEDNVMSYKELQARAKELGINSFGKTKDDLVAEIKAQEAQN